MEKHIFSTVIARKINRFQAVIGHLQVGNFAGAKYILAIFEIYRHVANTDVNDSLGKNNSG